jgi:phosphatidate cytidylyltransferase
MAEPLVGYAAAAYGGALAAGLGAIVAVERGRLDRIRSSVLFQRWLTWLVIASLYLGSLLAGPTWFAMLVAATAAVALGEFGRLARLGRGSTTALGVSGAALVLGLAAGTDLRALVAVALVPVAVAARAGAGRWPPRDACVALLGVAYIATPLAHAVLILQRADSGVALLLTVGLAVAASDVGAFAAGRALGGPRLAPSISPNKRWSGLAGNAAGAAAVVALMRPLFAGLGVSMAFVLALGVALAAVAGDLAESLLKRRAGVKDAGSWLPGFGGLLDRIDSLLFALPAAYYLGLLLPGVLR